ncbi:MarR family winged helix-turn-helix transcriptional regulator [Micromonospora sp. WMMD714]|uniref:MarR family winged helix-turn-helix transcriptional regulator n=1 Tax=Micromonospora sp. WMMD714 TaxID=3016097 RepID=UPI00249CCED2|nr:MarR family winged helix-turn-helix transcriptional regulator [Micromonospora sp. WMMD714]WFE65141.1 MarR family winged helix-turn-helix transcriptional regulator [Micromonospora sp. WMMD714]
MAEPEYLNDRERRAWHGFLTMQEELRRHMNRQLLGASGLSLADFSVLSALSQSPDGSLRVFELRELLRWEKTRLTHQVSRMVTRGLVERRSSREDARGNVVALTGQGRSAIELATPLHVNHVRRVFFDAISPRQVDALAAVSEAVLQALQDEPIED